MNRINCQLISMFAYLVFFFVWWMRVCICVCASVFMCSFFSVPLSNQIGLNCGWITFTMMATKIEFVFDTRLCKSNALLFLFAKLFYFSHKFYGINDKKNLTRIHQSEHIKAHIFMNGLTTFSLNISRSSLFFWVYDFSQRWA